MESRLPGFHGEFLRELDICRIQLRALAAAVPDDKYGWSPTTGTRPFSAILVHIAAGNLALLRMAGARLPDDLDLYGPSQGDELAQFAAMIRKNVELERTLTTKQDVLDLLRRSFEAVQQSFAALSADGLERAGNFFGERTTVRRVYMRILAHTHEHMGQSIAYVRSMGIPAPWPDPLRELDRMFADTRSR
jgi:uncharacterized damage-inducible protein DinB